MSVLAVSRSEGHSLVKDNEPYIYLLKHQGVQGDVHCSSSAPTHKSDINPRQVHLIESELFQDLAKPDKDGVSYQIYAGELGENITTFGVKLAELKKGSKIYFGDEKGCAVVKLTGLRYPGKKIEDRWEKLVNRFNFEVTDKKTKEKKMYKKAVGVMGVVEREGYAIPGQKLRVEQPKDGKALGDIKARK